MSLLNSNWYIIDAFTVSKGNIFMLAPLYKTNFLISLLYECFGCDNWFHSNTRSIQTQKSHQLLTHPFHT